MDDYDEEGFLRQCRICGYPPSQHDLNNPDDHKFEELP